MQCNVKYFNSTQHTHTQRIRNRMVLAKEAQEEEDGGEEEEEGEEIAVDSN